MATGLRVNFHRVDRNGGIVEVAPIVTIAVDDISAADPGASVLDPVLLSVAHLPRTLLNMDPVLGPGPFTIVIAGVTGTHEASLNGSRTFTRTGDMAGTIGVNCEGLTYDATSATFEFPADAFVENVPWWPKRESFDFSS